ncbi:MAG: hypothetical protein JKY96_07825 [Phycisphaerales bacterium]|nr:hypothetical protein [Phycisphaerales bacterium]
MDEEGAVVVETDGEVLSALLYRDGWNPAHLVVQESEVGKNEQWLQFQWRWNLYAEGETLQERLKNAGETVERLWKDRDAADADPKNAWSVISLRRAHTSGSSLDFLDPDGNRIFELVVEIRNGREIIRVDQVSIDGNSITMSFPHYGSRIEASLDQSGWLEGEWIKERGDEEEARLPFSAATRNMNFCPTNGVPLAYGERTEIEGRWVVNFSKSGRAIGEFELLNPNENESEYSRILGTFLTQTGDFRYLAGAVHGDGIRAYESLMPTRFQMSVFDGAHAFLFTAEIQSDGSLKGGFYSGNWHHETWTAVRDDDAQLPDAFKETTIADEDALGEMVFKNLEGIPTRVLDLLDESNAKARIIEIFGTWCPNCTDAGRELVSLRARYGDDLAVVGLAFEITEDFDRSVTQVKRHHEHIGTDWPILIAGLSDKAKASIALPVLDKVRSYPTLIFLNKDNEVQAVYTGFTGPATGEAYKEQRQRFEALIEEAINE